MKAYLGLSVTLAFFNLLSCTSSNDFAGGDGSSAISTDDSAPVSKSNTSKQKVKAVSNGSFSVWANPSDPSPGQPYELHLEVSVFDSKGTYHCRDLSGSVAGSDRFFLSIEQYCRGGANFFVGTRPGAVPGKTIYHYRFHIPGASAKIVDVIKVRSEILNESRTLELRF